MAPEVLCSRAGSLGPILRNKSHWPQEHHFLDIYLLIRLDFIFHFGKFEGLSKLPGSVHLFLFSRKDLLFINPIFYLHGLEFLVEANHHQSSQRDKQMEKWLFFLPCSSSSEIQVGSLHILYP